MTTQALGQDRNTALYGLAKPRSQLRDKVTEEIEYEKNCDECTFKPEITSNRV
jgi:ribosomal protein L44E